MAIESRIDPVNIDGGISWGDEGPVNGRSLDTPKHFPVNGTLHFRSGSAEAAAKGKNVVKGAIAKASVEASQRAVQQSQGPRQSGR